MYKQYIMFTTKYKSYLYSKYGSKRPEFFEPHPRKKYSILGKRKLADAFGEEIYYNKERYGQEILPNFFKYNIGHGVKKIEIVNIKLNNDIIFKL